MGFRSTWAAISGAALAASLFAPASALAQNNPFPTSGHYAQGFIPPAVTAAAVQSSYDNWTAKYLLSDCGSGYYRVDNGDGDSSTFSEGQGYGMVITAYFGDKTAFDGLWSFAQKNFNSNGVMGWHVTCSGFTTSDGGAGSATDGDTDIAFALIVAAAQWGGTYSQQAQTYIANLKTVEFATCTPSGRNVPTAGNWQAGSAACTAAGGSNTSYWMPGYYRVFQKLTGDAFWGKTADDVVALYNLAADPTTGIIVNEVDQNGVAIAGQTYDYNSCRIPWRAVLDYLWFGTAGAKQATTKITNWADTVGISKIVDGYDANGTPTGQYNGVNAFVGGFTAGAMSNSQSLVNSFATYFVGVADDNGAYYGASLRTLYLLELSGNQWNPLAESSDAGAQQQDAGTATSVGGPDSGTTKSGDDGGAPTTGVDSGAVEVDSGAVEVDGGKEEAASSGSSGCGCRLGPSEAALAPGVGIASALGIMIAARRRKR
jgi:endo-1,4-beta-D-glucanase Y